MHLSYFEESKIYVKIIHSLTILKKQKAMFMLFILKNTINQFKSITISPEV